MKARLRLPQDEAAVLELARLQTVETHPHLAYDEGRARDTFRRAIKYADPIIFVAEDDDGEVVGFLHANLCPYAWNAGFFTSQEVISVRPDKRGTRAAALLMALYVEWSDSLQPQECFAGISNGRRVIAFAKWLDRSFGFKPMGVSMKRIRDVR